VQSLSGGRMGDTVNQGGYIWFALVAGLIYRTTLISAGTVGERRV
jgi:hypothetical protein